MRYEISGRRRLNVRRMVLASSFAAIMAICAWISIPILDIGFTLQLFGVFLALGVLGGRWGTVSILIYLLLGMVGLPVFSGFRGGLGVLLGPTGGYLTGFLAAGCICWLATGLFGKGAGLPAMVMGLLGCYGFGSAWFVLLYGVSWTIAVQTCVLPFLVPDLMKLALAHILTCRIKPHLRF